MQGLFTYIWLMKIRIYSFLLILLFAFKLDAQTDKGIEAKLKAIFMYNFTRYFEWNNQNTKNEFTIGILGRDSLIKNELERLALTKKVGNLPIKVVTFKSIADITYTEILYIDFAKIPDYQISKTKANTLVITENNSDLHNAMIAFFISADNKQKFAINEVNIKKVGLTMSPELNALAYHKITGTNAKLDEEKANEWKSVFDKFTEAIKNNSSEIKLTKKEAEEVVKTISEKTQIIKDKEEKLISQEKILSRQENEIKIQQQNLQTQKNKIDEQLKSILTQEQKLKLQEQKLELTIQQNKIQEADLEVAKEEVELQQSKINTQKSVLLDQQKDIDEQNKKLITQLGQINSQKTILYLAGFLVLIIAVALFMAYRSNKNKQRANALLSRQKVEIEHQRELVEEKQKEILDSINYAKRIQYSLLASDKLLSDNLPNHFLFFKPKDVVSGDFYWGSKLNNDNFVLVTADSTGHGVPGSIMSMLNISCLNEAINADKFTQPSDILNATRKKIINHLANDGSAEGGKDGMDCSLVSFDFKNKKLIYAAANNPVWIIRDKTFIALTADRMPVGKHNKDTTPFTQHEFDLQSSDMVYTLTDGFPDQFGGPKGKKFKYKQLEELLISVSHESMEIQKQKLEEVFENWKGNLEQVDDVCVIGVRV